MKKRLLIIIALLYLTSVTAMHIFAESSGFIKKDGREVFPIGCYELPKDDNALKAMAAAGINLVRCRDKAELDRVAAVGMQGWISLKLQNGKIEKLSKKINSVKDHPALAVWEGPDEIVHSFTRISDLYRVKKIHKTPKDWQNQVPAAVEYSAQQAAIILPRLRAGAKLIRSLDKQVRPIWINEASRSDLKYMRGYIDNIDITGCDMYPVSATNRKVVCMGRATERFKQIGRGQKPVWMVLQAFSWHELGGRYGKKEAYPSFDQSRLMAYDVIVHGAKGIIYWGSHYLKSDDFRQSLYALTRELAALQPFLVSPEVAKAQLTVIDEYENLTDSNVMMTVCNVADEWLVVLVNEDAHAHMGVEVSGLEALNGRRLALLYSNEETEVAQGELITRMMPYQVKVFATSRKWETSNIKGRDYGRSGSK